jgi:trehalose/maltose hydrolase-like predicted phosphorylase
MTIRSSKDMSYLPFSPTPDPAWLLIEEGVDLAREREIESIFTIANGYIGTRASIAEDGRFSHPSTFAAGVYVTDASPELGTRAYPAGLESGDSQRSADERVWRP